MLDLAPGDPLVKEYLQTAARLEGQGRKTEGQIDTAFATLLDKTSRRLKWAFVEKEPLYVKGNKRIVPDGTVFDHNEQKRGWWEAKDPGDSLAVEIRKKLDLGYPTWNTIFEDFRRAVLYQDKSKLGEYDLRKPEAVSDLLNVFYAHKEDVYRNFDHAMEKFGERIPDLAAKLQKTITEAHKNLPPFQRAYAEFLTLCRASLNPALTETAVDEMLIQHLLTERLIRNLFGKAEFSHDNVIAHEVAKVITALASKSFSLGEFQKQLDPYFKAVETAADASVDIRDRQALLNSVYERFFQNYSWKTADTHGIVYTPPEIVDYMVKAVEEALQEEFGRKLGDDGVVILDPCTGTGNFIVHLIEKMSGAKLEKAYREQLFANEVMLLPYYVASLNIERSYYDRTGEYRAFEGLCFVDTLDMAEAPQMGLFSEENTARVQREKNAPITVIIGNPPYNVGQKSENDNNQNRKYKHVDTRVADTYARDSKAQNKNSLSDMYVKFFRWASDRLGDRDGIVCFVSNSSFVDQMAFDGFRKHAMQEFTRIDHIDLHGNVRRNPKLSGTTHNVFGIQVGVGITVAVRKKNRQARLRYHRVPEMWRKQEKLDWLAEGQVPWQTLTPDAEHTWLIPEHADEYRSFLPIEELFDLRSRGLETTRDEVVYDFNQKILADRVKAFIEVYNAEVDRYRRTKEPFSYTPTIKWSSRLKECLARGTYAEFSQSKIKESLYRPFNKRWVFFDAVLNQRLGQWPNIDGRVIWVKVGSAWPFFALMADCICDLLPQSGSHCFPLSHLRDDAPAKFGLKSKEDLFHYLHALLHHPGYRERYAQNLKRELPRIPRAPDPKAFVTAGRKLAHLHVNYESLKPYPLKEIESPGEPISWRVEKMKLSADKTSLKVNDWLTLDGIPPEAFDYRLGSRSALEWVIDQYRVKNNSDPNRPDDLPSLMWTS